MADNRTGKITQVIGAVLDIKFGSDNLPEINDAIDIQTKDGGKLVVEVAQHLGEPTAYQSTEKHRNFQNNLQRQKFWKQGSRSLTFYAHTRRVERSVCSVVRE